MKKVALAIAVITGMTLSAQPASAQLCMAGIFIAAFHANATANRELTAREAASCGLFYRAGTNQTASATKAKKQPRKTAAKARPQ